MLGALDKWNVYHVYQTKWKKTQNIVETLLATLASLIQ